MHDTNERHQSTDELLDRAVEQIRERAPDAAVVAAAAERVWANLNGAGALAAAGAAEVAEIRGCEDYQALIPAYRAGSLSPARATLLEDHCRECVPCRKALKAASVDAAAPVTVRRGTASRWGGRWALAAALLATVGLAGYLTWFAMPFGHGTAATVAAIDGSLFRVDETAHLPIEIGTEIAEGDRVRTGRDGGGVLTLADGSRVELRERSELVIHESRAGTTLDLARGSVIVEAAKQRDRKLYVRTDDCEVAVTGTIFSVNHGTKGSRVSVIEGEVRVDFGGDEAVLHPGDQITTHTSLARWPLDEEIAWSRNADHYIALLGELAALRRDLARVPQPNWRFESRLLDLMPAGTAFYAAIPNLGATLEESYRVATERLAQSPTLGAWWREHAGEAVQAQIEEIVEQLSELGGYLGDEVAAGGVRNLAGEGILGPVVMAEVANEAGLRAFFEDRMDTLPVTTNMIVVVDDPRQVPDGPGRLFIWLREDLAVVTPSRELLATVGGFVLDGVPNAFVGSAFHQQIEALYHEGVGLVAAVDLGEVIPDQGDELDPGLVLAGFDNARFLMFEQKRSGERTEHRAALTFDDERHGLVSWLAAPAPMGGLSFISPDAQLFAAFVVKDPSAMLHDIQQLTGDQDGFVRWLDDFSQAHGVDLRADVAATLGGEVAFAIDGPLVPVPSWKLVLEVYDPARLQWSLEQAVEQANAQLSAAGKEPIAIEQEVVGGRTYYRLPGQVVEVHYTFVEGYLVAGPSRALIDTAIRTRNGGYTIAASPRFTDLLPAGARADFSALFYQDMATLLQAVLDRLPQQLTAQQQAAIDALRDQAKSSLAYAYGEEDRLIFAATTDGDLLTGGLMTLFSWASPFAMGEAAEEPPAAGEDDGAIDA